ncbi:MAG: hypothetical protein J1E83_11585 [Lachnospiraceae bacterium]|nr:hypothetical protein [Lachnospiraceae bacterium]
MKRKQKFLKGGAALLIFCVALSLIWMNVQQGMFRQTAMADARMANAPCVVLDAGHGGSR